MSDTSIGGLRYYIEEAGRGDALVLLHGFTGSATGWRVLANHLTARWRVLAIDLPGHGRSDAPAEVGRYAMPHVAADLSTLLARRGIASAHWLGYSMGGRLALYMAVHHGPLVRSLILESASPGLVTPDEREARRAADDALADRIETRGIVAFVDEWERLPLFAGQGRLPVATRAALRAQRLANDPAGLANSLRGMGTGAQPSLWPALHGIHTPALLLVGQNDEKFVDINRRMAAAMPAAELRVIPDAGHTIHLEQPDLFGDAVTRFLTGLLERGAQYLTEGQQDAE